MKTSTMLMVAAALAVASLDSVHALRKYLEQLPNGELFEMEVAHITTDKLNDFGKAFSAAGSAWSTKLCESTFPGMDMTVGQAFGDPCCTWKVGEDAAKTVNAWTDKPTTKTECDKPTTAPAASSVAPAPAAATTPAPAAADKTTPAPAGTPAAKTPNLRPASKCGVKGDTATQRESKSIDTDSEEIDY